MTARFTPSDTTDYTTAPVSTTINVATSDTGTDALSDTRPDALADTGGGGGGGGKKKGGGGGGGNPVLSAFVLKEKVGKKTKLFARITSSAGGLPVNIQLPYQAPAFTHIAVVANGRTIVASAKKGKRSVMQTVYSV